MVLFYYIYFYLVLFYPVIEAYSGVNVIIYLFIALLIIATHQKKFKRDYRNLKFANVSLMCLIIYVVTQTLFFNGDVVVLKAAFKVLIVPLTNVYSLSCLSKICNRKDFLQDLITISTVAAIVSLLLYLVPSVAQTIRDLTGATVQLNNDIRDRGYGIASSLFSGYPLIQAWCAFLCLIKGRGKFKYIQFILITFSIVLNARTSLFLLIGMIILHYLMFSSFKNTMKLVLYVLLGVVLFVTMGVYERFADVFNFVQDAIFMISDQFFGTSYTNGFGHFSGLMDSFLIWPENIKEWIFGHGNYMLTGSQRGSSDIGFILQLNYGGVVYLFLISYPLLYVMNKLYKNKRWEPFLCIFLTVFLLNWKGDMFLQTNFVFLTLSLFLNTDFLGTYENNFRYNCCIQ